MFHYFRNLTFAFRIILITIPLFLLSFPVLAIETLDVITQSSPEIYSNNHPWTLWKEKDNRRVAYRNYQEGPLIEIKGRVTVNSSLSGALLFLQDEPNIPKWLHNAASAQTVKTLADNQNVSRIKFHAFWPVSDREMIIQSHFWQNDDLSIEVSSKDAVENYQAYLSDGVVPIKVIYAHWYITPVDKNTIVIEQRIVADPNGAIPHWLTNRISLKSTWKTLGNIAEQLPTSSLQQQTLAQIQEP